MLGCISFLFGFWTDGTVYHRQQLTSPLLILSRSILKSWGISRWISLWTSSPRDPTTARSVSICWNVDLVTAWLQWCSRTRWDTRWDNPAWNRRVNNAFDSLRLITLLRCTDFTHFRPGKLLNRHGGLTGSIKKRETFLPETIKNDLEQPKPAQICKKNTTSKEPAALYLRLTQVMRLMAAVCELLNVKRNR